LLSRGEGELSPLKTPLQRPPSSVSPPLKEILPEFVSPPPLKRGDRAIFGAFFEEGGRGAEFYLKIESMV